jgi:hypothetical protein
MSDPSRLSDLLGPAAKAFGVEDPRAVSALWRRWAEVVGESIAAHAEPTSLRDGVLKVRADSPVWATEIGYLADDIRSAIERELGPGSVRTVSVWTGPSKGSNGSVGGGRGRAEKASATGVPPDPELSPEEAVSRARSAWSKGRSRGSAEGSPNPENRR